MTIGSASNGSGKDPACQLQQFGPLSDNILIRSTDPEQVELFNKGISSHDQKERTEIYQKFMQNVHDNLLLRPAVTAAPKTTALAMRTAALLPPLITPAPWIPLC